MKYTKNYKFKKPEPYDTRNINDINDSFDLVDAKLKETQDNNENLKATFEQLTINAGDSNAEIVAARRDNAVGTTFKSLPNRLDNFSSQLAQKASKQFVSYTEFGAVLDGITDDSLAVRMCHKYANENKLSVIQNGGTLLCNFTVDVKTSCTLDLDFIINDQTPNTVYNIISDNPVADYVYNGSFSTGQINGFNDFKGKFFVPTINDNTWLLGVRASEQSGEIYYHRQPIAVDNNGILISSPIYLGNTGSFTIKYLKDIHEKGVSFSGGHIISTLSKIGFPRFIRCSRNNCVIKDISIKNTTLPTSTSNYASGLIEIIGCANITLKNIQGLNNSIDVTTAHSYVFDITDAYNVSIENCNITQGWGAIASHFCDTIKVDSCILNRCDNHYGIFGKFLVSNSTLTGIGTVCIGYGNANVSLSNLTIENTLNTSFVVYTRQDFNITFSGTLTIDTIRFMNEVFTRIIQYQIGTGIANTELSIGSFNVVASNIITTKALIMNTTTNTVSVKIYNSTLVPCTSNGSCSLEIYNSTLRSLITTGITRIFNCHIISFGAVFTSNVYFYGCYIFAEINNSLIIFYATGTQFNNNVTSAYGAHLIGCFATTTKTVTANTKNVINCLNIT